MPEIGHERIIMGIDPGTNVMGYALLSVDAGKPNLMLMGVIKLSKLVTQHLPDELAIEAPFFGKNVQSMLKLGRAQGVAMAAALTRDIPIAEYPPRSVKQSITGVGSASKEQVANMLQHLLRIPDEKMPALLDATDALAVALTHFYETGKPQLPKGPRTWAEFLSKNPDRLAQRRTPDADRK